MTPDLVVYITWQWGYLTYSCCCVTRKFQTSVFKIRHLRAYSVYRSMSSQWDRPERHWVVRIRKSWRLSEVFPLYCWTSDWWTCQKLYFLHNVLIKCQVTLVWTRSCMGLWGIYCTALGILCHYICLKKDYTGHLKKVVNQFFMVTTISYGPWKGRFFPL